MSNSLEVGETRMKPAVEANQISPQDDLVNLSMSRKRVEQKKRRVKKRRVGHKHIGMEVRSVRGLQSEKQKPPRPAGLPPYMI